MRSLHIPVLVLLALAPLQSSAQQPGRPQNLADSDSLRALVAQVPVLDMQLVELAPTVKLEGISAVVADRAGNIQEFGSRGDGPGQFNNAHGIAVGPDGNIWVADRENGRLQWFDLTGKHLGTRRYGGQFYNVVFDNRGEMWAAVHPKGVSLDEEFEVVHFDMKTGKTLGRIPGRSHQLGIGFDGSIFPATRSERLIVYRPKK